LYEDFAEEFLDEVFGYESKMERQEWEKEVAQKQSIIFDPNEIRKKLKSQADSNISYSSRKGNNSARSRR
jgi:hypothetical protein